MSEVEKVEGVVIIPGPAAPYLNERQRVAYQEHRKDLIKWLSRIGKKPDEMKGYAHHTTKNYAHIIDRFYREKWEAEGYTTDLRRDDADRYLRGLVMADDEYSSSHLHNVKLALKAYFRYRDGEDADEWEPDIKVPSSSGVSQPKDYVSQEERTMLREASLEYGTVPAYHALTPDERDQWRMFLARRFGKAMKDVSPDDWKRANGFKYPSLIHASLDAGLRPIEVNRAKTYWVDLENAALRIPEQESSKNEDNWVVSLRRETAEYLARWMEEREMYEKYDDTDQLWLTRHNNPYNASSLRYVLEAVCDVAGIERHISWYAMRHSTGTYMSREGGLAAAQAQLRHTDIKTTAKYDQAPVEDRRNHLDKMG